MSITKEMPNASSPRKRFERWTIARTGDPRKRRELVVAVALGSALFSLAVCVLAYWLTGVRPQSPPEYALCYGLPVLLPLLITPPLLNHLLGLAATLSEQSDQLADEVRRRRQAEAKLAILVTTDDLTQLPNRRAFFAQAAEIANGTSVPGCVAVLDLDNFKQLNDTHGHAAGDDALRACGGLIREHIGPPGVAARLGGEEFGVMLPGCDLQAAHGMLDALRAAVDRLGTDLSISAGLSEWADGESIDAALGRADSALYRAKQRGRNRIEIASIVDDDGFGTELAPVARRDAPSAG